ncbi:uncharacterized protein LOC133371447 [Rhineura floridana]|uniref:uncharacterized protein LOC133371447 n=1 Tax=Rhineura floridana TaxID=261503 RepID=UPI002AC87119|nr:uncharacterized protein LOC133371447 [Rhineura floridana]
MKGALLCVLVLLMAIGGGASRQTEGEELCRNWLYGSEPPSVGAFQCVEERDGAGSRFCCGTCSPPCSCSLGEAPICEQRRPTGRRLQAVTQGRGEVGPDHDWWNMFLVIGAAIVVVTAFYWIYYFYFRNQFWERSYSEERQQFHLENLLPTRRSTINLLHRFSACLRRALPTFGSEDLQDTYKDLSEGCDNSPAQDNAPAVEFHRGSTGDGAVILPAACFPVGVTPRDILELRLENAS